MAKPLPAKTPSRPRMTMRGVNGGGTKRRMRAEEMLSRKKLQKNRMSSFLQEASRSLMECKLDILQGLSDQYDCRTWRASTVILSRVSCRSNESICSIFHDDPTIDHDQVWTSAPLAA